MKSNKSIIGYIFISMVCVAISCKNSKKAGPAVNVTVPVVSQTVRSENVAYYDSYPATVVATDEVQLRSEVTGFVTGLYFKEGSKVLKGSKLYEIDRTKYQASYEEAKANVAIAASNLQKAERDYDRYKTLDAENAIAKQIMDDALTNLNNSRMQLQTATSVLVTAESEFKYSLITAPFTGSIGFSQVKSGTFVTAGQTLLNTISSDDPIGVDFVADEKSLPYFVKIQNGKSPGRDSTFRVVLPDNSEYFYKGNLSVIDRAIDPQTGTIKIRAIFPNKERILRPGLNCKIKILSENSGIQLTVPSKAIIEQMSEFLVYFIDNNNVVRQRRITVGPSIGDKTIVRSGLAEGDMIVVDGLQKIRDGQTVSFSDPGKEDIKPNTEKVENK